MNTAKNRNPIGVEAWFSLIALLAVILVAFVPSLAQIPWLARVLCGYSILVGAVLAVLYFFEIGEGRSWLGSIGPLAFAGWALYLILHT